MQKKFLRSLKRIYATPLMEKISRENHLDNPILIKSYWDYTHKFYTRYDILLRCQTRGGILMICAFFPDDVSKGIKTPRYEIFCNPEGNEYITRVLDKDGKEEKWSTAVFCNLTDVNNSHFTDYILHDNRNVRVWQNPEGKKTIKDFLGTNKSGAEGLIEYQWRCRDKKIKENEARQQAPWDKDMDLIPPILSGFKRWAQHDAADENFIFYASINDKTGYCTYCEKEVPLINPVRNEAGKCPCCKRNIKFKLRSKIQGLRTHHSDVECIQKIKGGFVIRTFDVCSAYRNRTYDNPDWSLRETDRYICLDNGNTKHYVWTLYKNKYTRWCPTQYVSFGYYRVKSKLYTKNISSLKKTVLKTSAIDLWDKLPCSVSEYLYVERGNPIVEKLAKIGMFKLAEDFIISKYNVKILNQSATELTKMLKIDNARLKRLKKIDEGMECLEWLQLEKISDTIWPDQMIKEFVKNQISSSAFGFLPSPISFVKAYNYIKRQQALSDENFYQTYVTWRDYYNLAEQNKWNVTASQIGWPKDLKKAHSDAVLFSKGQSIKNQAKFLEKKWPEVNKILPDIKKFEFKDNKYAVVAPENIEDMVKEGIALSHCIDHADFYYDRIQKHEAYPFFLRKVNSIETPWYTLEVESSGNIRQKRTTGDNQNPDINDAIPFLQKFMKNFRKIMTDEEKKQGEAANQKRIKEYEELRKKGKKIWRGKLAGQLLADVLEADFMEAI